MTAKTITVSNPRGDGMGVSIYALLDVLEQWSRISTEERIIIDMSRVNFVHPFFIMPLCALISAKQKSEASIKFKLHPKIENYLKTIYFPYGFNAVDNENWEVNLSGYTHKSYLPACKFPVTAQSTYLREQFLSTFERILIKQLRLHRPVVTVLKYLIGEAIDNITDHSGALNGWIMVQHYPQKGYLDVCIADTGRGIAGSYRQTGNDNLASDAKALEYAVNGKSTKQITETRGYGIDTSRRMLVNGLRGKYFLLSGTAFYIYTNELEQITPLPGYGWAGTTLALQIPAVAPRISITQPFWNNIVILIDLIKLHPMNKVVHILNYLPSTITTRKAIEAIRDHVALEDTNNLAFDFQGIDFISRAFADEFVHFVIDNKLKARFINTNPIVGEMLNVVEKNRSSRNKNYHNIAVTPFPGKEQLNHLLSLI